MKTSIFKQYKWTIGLLLTLIGCDSHEAVLSEAMEDSNVMKFAVFHPEDKQSRATDTGFETNDQIGISITHSHEPLQMSGNYVNNERLTFDGKTWKPARPIYWENGKYNVYATYPYLPSILSPNEQPFQVSCDQSTVQKGDTLGGYEASDLLWANAIQQSASEQVIPLQFKHCMSKLVIRLIKSADNPDFELPEKADVYIHNTVTRATIDLAAGVATQAYQTQAKSIKALPLGHHRYTAIVVPQRISSRTPLVEVVMNGVSYMVESRFVFKPGIQHTLSVIIARDPEQVKIEIGGEIEDWEPAPNA